MSGIKTYLGKRQLLLRLGCLLAFPVMLGACNSSDPGGTPPDPEPSGILSAFFVESFDAFAESARRLVEEDPRYLLQDAPEDAYYADINRNGSFDAFIDVLLNSSPIRHAGIQFAHAAGLTGAGQIIAISDAGFRLSHEVFDGKSVTAGPGITEDAHGTFVASIAAADTPTMIGVAPEADLILGSYDTFETLTQTATAARTMEAVALNNSWGFVNLPVGTTSYDQIFGSGSGTTYLDALRAYSAEGVVLFAVSNEYFDTQSGLMPALPLLEPGMEDGWLAVVNGVPEMVNGDIIAAERVSAGCLEAARWCIAADGSWTGATSDTDTSYEFGTGTSYAAPVVAGALALLAEAFPDLSRHDLRIRLLASADNDFAGFTTDASQELVPGFFHDYSSEWGHGFLDVKAALLPIGEVVIPLADGSGISLSQPLVVEGGVSGDAITTALSGLNIRAVDTLSGKFGLPAEQLVARRRAAPLFAEQLANVTTTGSTSCCDSLGFFDDTVALPLGDGAFGVSLVVPVDEAGDGAFGVVAERQFDFFGGELNTSFGIGNDGGGLTPNWYTDSHSSLVTAGLSFQHTLGQFAQLEIEAGIATAFNHSGSLNSTDILLNSARVTYAREGLLRRGDRLALSATLPTAITSGTTEVTLPVVHASGEVEHQAISVGLAPSNREVRLGLQYEIDTGARSKIVFSLQHAENLGNVTGARDTGAFLGLKAEF